MRVLLASTATRATGVAFSQLPGLVRLGAEAQLLNYV